MRAESGKCHQAKDARQKPFQYTQFAIMIPEGFAQTWQLLTRQANERFENWMDEQAAQE